MASSSQARTASTLAPGVESILARTVEGTPLIDGHVATFVWQGGDPPKLIGDWTGWEWCGPVDLVEVAPDVPAHEPCPSTPPGGTPCGAGWSTCLAPRAAPVDTRPVLW